MPRRFQPTLLAVAAIIGVLGLGAFLLAGYRTTEHCHGVRLATVLWFCGFLAGGADRRPRSARAAAITAICLLAAAGLNYARLALKWHDPGSGALWRPALGATMAVTCLAALFVLLRTCPRPSWSALKRARRGIALASGGLLLTGGLALGVGSRLPATVAAQAVETPTLSAENLDRLRTLLADPQRRGRVLRDPRVRAILEGLGIDLDGVLVASPLADTAEGPVVAQAPAVDPADPPALEAPPDPPEIPREGVARSVPSRRTGGLPTPGGIGVSARIDPRINGRVPARQLRASVLKDAAVRDRADGAPRLPAIRSPPTSGRSRLPRRPWCRGWTGSP